LKNVERKWQKKKKKEEKQQQRLDRKKKVDVDNSDSGENPVQDEEQI